MQADVERARLELRALYARVQAAGAVRPEFSCERSGRCCRFGEAGHQLYLTRLEYEEMQAGPGPRTDGGRAAEVCPWLVNGLCGNREGRALACRTYFCSDETAAARVTERAHREIRALHERYGLDYAYRSLHDHMNS